MKEKEDGLVWSWIELPIYIFPLLKISKTNEHERILISRQIPSFRVHIQST